MLKVFTSVFVLESMAITFDEMEAEIGQEAAELQKGPVGAGRRHAVELQLKAMERGRGKRSDG